MKSRRLEPLARAALLGLLAAAQFSCSEADENNDPSDGASGGAANTGGAPSTGGALASAGADNVGAAGSGGAQGVLSSKIVPDLSLDEFTEMCGEAGGVVETHAHCGGAVTGPGFSYDSDTDQFTEHTCAGYNTCTGFSCVVEA